MSLRLSVYGQGLHDHSLLSVLAESCLADQVEQRTPDTADFLGDLVEASPLFAAVCEAAELDYALLPPTVVLPTLVYWSVRWIRL